MARKKNNKNSNSDTPPREKRPFYDIDRPLHRILPCIFVTVAVLLGFFLVLDYKGMNDTKLGQWSVTFFAGLFSKCVYVLPALLLVMGIRWRSDIRRHRAVRRIVYFSLLPVLAGALLYMFQDPGDVVFSVRDFYMNGTKMAGAGLFGSLLGYGMWRLTYYIGVPVLVALYVVLFLYDFLHITPASFLEKRAKRRAEKAAAKAAAPVTPEAPTATPATGEVAEPAASAATPAAAPAPAPVKTADPKPKRPSARELRKQAKEAERARKAAEAAERKRRAHEEAGYFPGEKEETFDELRRRLDAEQMEIRRSGLATPKPRPATTYETKPPKRTAAGRATAPERMTSVDTPLPTPAPAAAAGASLTVTAEPIGSARADAVFRSFDPLHDDLSAAGGTVLFPADTADGRDRHDVPAPTGRKKSAAEAAGGSFRIRVEHMDVKTTRNPDGTAGTAPKTAADFADITGRAVSAETPVSPLPFVHPATEPIEQPQSTRPTAGYNPPPPPASVKPTLPDFDPAGADTVRIDAPQVTDAEDKRPAGAPVIRSYESTAATDPGIAITDRVVEHGARYPIPDEAPKKAAREPRQNTADEAAPKRKTPDYAKNYVFPPLSLLNRPILVVNGDTEGEIQELGRLLIAAFATFKIDIQIKEVVVGPRITRFSIEPPAGVRINTLTNLTEDICRLMSSKTLRIVPIPETPYLGVEIPNRRPTNVSLASLIDTDAFRNAKNVTTVPLGANVTGAPVFADICKMPHLLVAGATGMGKSVFVNSILLSLLYRARPDEVKLILVDPKQVEMSLYNGIPHLLVPPVIDAKRAAGALIWAVGEMERRYQLMVKANVRTIESYNAWVREDPERGEIQPKIIIVIDELNDLMMQAKDAVESSIMRLAQKARAAGIHLILGTQRPSVDVITGTIKANIPSRVALHVTSGTDSRTILDVYGAEKLLDKGDMLIMLAGAEPMRIQSAFASDDEVENVTTFLRNNAGPVVYDEIVSAQIESETEKYKNSGKKERSRDEGDEEYDGSVFEDSRFMEACNVAFECGKISTSLLQRRCKLGYGKAAGYIDTMQMLGIVSEPDGSKPREILMSKDEFMEMVARESHSGD